QAPHVTYVNNGVSHDLWYENRQSFEAKIGFIQQRGLAGFAVWRLGQEDPGIWPSLAGLRSPCTPVAGFANSADRVYFPQTGHRPRGGFYKLWQRQGGLAQFGYPLSDEFVERSPTDGNNYTVQYFERARFEWHPEHTATPAEFQLGLLGVWLAQQ